MVNKIYDIKRNIPWSTYIITPTLILFNISDNSIYIFMSLSLSLFPLQLQPGWANFKIHAFGGTTLNKIYDINQA